jgi:chemotaxis protein MotB
MAQDRSEDSGVSVYPKLPVPKQGARDSRPKVSRERGSYRRWPIVALALVAIAIGVVVRTYAWPDGRIAELDGKLDDAHKETATARGHADDLQAELDRVQKARVDAEHKLTDAERASHELADRAADAERKAKEATAVEDKLRGAIDKSQGSVSSEGDEIHLQLVDHILFKTGDDQLTDRGKLVLDKVANALQQIPDKQIWVQGHTDDQPIYVPPPPAPPTTTKPTKPAVPSKPAAPAAPAVKFITNWELSAARALQVVHYLQDTSKIDPTRLAAVAFGQYRPVSARNKALNRRIEIVLYPKRVVAK